MRSQMAGAETADHTQIRSTLMDDTSMMSRLSFVSLWHKIHLGGDDLLLLQLDVFISGNFVLEKSKMGNVSYKSLTFYCHFEKQNN